MKQPIYYTVITGKRSCIVTYAVGPAYEVKLFSGAFSDPGSASQEFKIAIQGNLEYLSQGMFDRKVSLLAERYKSDLIKLQAWKEGQPLHIERTSSMAALTNEQYINALPASGLELAEDCLELDLETLQENDLPVSDTVASLLMVQSHTRSEEEQL